MYGTVSESVCVSTNDRMVTVLSSVADGLALLLRYRWTEYRSLSNHNLKVTVTMSVIYTEMTRKMLTLT